MKNSILAVLLTLFLTGIGYVYLQKSESSSENIISVVSDVNEEVELNTKGGIESSEKFESEYAIRPESGLQEESSLDDIHRELARSPAIAEVEASGEKLEELGYIDRGILKAYEEYDIETLEKLGSQGDFAALNVLAGKYARLGNTKKTVGYLGKAAVMGSTSAAKGLCFYNLMFVEDSRSSSEMQSTALIEGVSWFSVAKLRGDPTADATLKDSLVRSGIDYTSIDWKAVNQRTEEIYSHLEGRRKAMGLPDFKNERNFSSDLEYFYRNY